MSKSDRFFLKSENVLPLKSFKTFSGVSEFKLENILIKFCASYLFDFASKIFSSIGSLSVLAFFIFCIIWSLVSVKLILERSDSSDLLIFFVPSRKLITLDTNLGMIGSGKIK